MAAEKTIPVSFRVSRRFKQLLEAAAASQHRSQTNMLETLLFEFCAERGIELAETTIAESTSSKGGMKK